MHRGFISNNRFLIVSFLLSSFYCQFLIIDSELLIFNFNFLSKSRKRPDRSYDQPESLFTRGAHEPDWLKELHVSGA